MAPSLWGPSAVLGGRGGWSLIPQRPLLTGRGLHLGRQASLHRHPHCSNQAPVPENVPRQRRKTELQRWEVSALCPLQLLRIQVAE